MTTNEFIPKNEQGVVYLFSKYHEKLGFEKILRIGTRFPDVIAMRDGKSVSIELEYKLGGLITHYLYEKLQTFRYRIRDPSGNPITVDLTWVYDNNIKAWRPTPIPWTESAEKAEEYIKTYKINTQNMSDSESMKILTSWGALTTNLSRRVPDRHGNIYESGKFGELYFRSLKPLCDVVVCWEVDCELDDPNIEIIELKNLPSLL